MSQNTRPQDHVNLRLKNPETKADGTVIDTVTCTIATPVGIIARSFRKKQRDLLVFTKRYSELIEKRLSPDADQDALDKQLDDNDEATYKCMFDQCAEIVNIPNDENNRPRGKDAIDWDNTDLEEVRNAIGFFSDRLSGSTSVTNG
jgi:hypothetical protein